MRQVVKGFISGIGIVSVGGLVIVAVKWDELSAQQAYHDTKHVLSNVPTADVHYDGCSVGRWETRALQQALSSSPRDTGLIIVSGPPGCGKSSVLRQYASTAIRERPILLLQGIGPTLSMQDALVQSIVTRREALPAPGRLHLPASLFPVSDIGDILRKVLEIVKIEGSTTGSSECPVVMVDVSEDSTLSKEDYSELASLAATGFVHIVICVRDETHLGIANDLHTMIRTGDLCLGQVFELVREYGLHVQVDSLATMLFKSLGGRVGDIVRVLDETSRSGYNVEGVLKLGDGHEFQNTAIPSTTPGVGTSASDEANPSLSDGLDSTVTNRAVSEDSTVVGAPSDEVLHAPALDVSFLGDAKSVLEQASIEIDAIVKTAEAVLERTLMRGVDNGTMHSSATLAQWAGRKSIQDRLTHQCDGDQVVLYEALRALSGLDVGPELAPRRLAPGPVPIQDLLDVVTVAPGVPPTLEELAHLVSTGWLEVHPFVPYALSDALEEESSRIAGKRTKSAAIGAIDDAEQDGGETLEPTLSVVDRAIARSGLERLVRIGEQQKSLLIRARPATLTALPLLVNSGRDTHLLVDSMVRRRERRHIVALTKEFFRDCESIQSGLQAVQTARTKLEEHKPNLTQTQFTNAAAKLVIHHDNLVEQLEFLRRWATQLDTMRCEHSMPRVDFTAAVANHGAAEE